MRKHVYVLLLILILGSCTTQKKLGYLNNMPISDSSFFKNDFPDYRLQYRDVLYITIKAMTPDGTINDFLASGTGSGSSTFVQSEAGQYLSGYDVNNYGEIVVPVLGNIKVVGSTLNEARKLIQNESDKHFINATVECKLLSFKFTIIGEVQTPGTFTNYNNYLTVFEALGRAGGISDFGRRDNLLLIRTTIEGTQTYKLNLQDQRILSGETYYLLPNDLIIVEPESKKIFNLNLPSFSFMIGSVTSVITTTLLLINFLK